MVIFATKLFEDSWLIVFASESDHKDASCVRMMHHIAQYFLCIFVIAAKLRASVVVWESEYSVYSFGTCLGIDSVYNLLHDSIDTSHGRNDPYLVSYSCLSIFAEISFECAFPAAAERLYYRFAFYSAVVKLSSKICLYIMIIKECTACDVMLGMADRESIFYYIFSSLISLRANL